jgi:hypothetical protein
MLKIDRRAPLAEIKRLLRRAAEQTSKRWRKANILFNVDP